MPLIDGVLGSVVPARTWFGALMSIVGIAMLEFSGSPPCVGDLLNFLSAVFFGIHMIRTEHISRRTKRENFLPLLGYEMAAMRDVSAIETAIVYGLEPVWGAGFAWFLLGERRGVSGWIGPALVLGGSLTVQIMGAMSNSLSREHKDKDAETNVKAGTTSFFKGLPLDYWDINPKDSTQEQVLQPNRRVLSPTQVYNMLKDIQPRSLEALLKRKDSIFLNFLLVTPNSHRVREFGQHITQIGFILRLDYQKVSTLFSQQFQILCKMISNLQCIDIKEAKMHHQSNSIQLTSKIMALKVVGYFLGL